MKRYILFSGYIYYPKGGWLDFQGSFDTIEEALKARIGDWYHIVDTFGFYQGGKFEII